METYTRIMAEMRFEVTNYERFGDRLEPDIAARRAFRRAFAFFCFSTVTTAWQASQRLRILDFVTKVAPHLRHCFVSVSSRGRMPGLCGRRWE
jgi:hypothetical protein